MMSGHALRLAAVALVVLATGCSTYIGTTASSFMRHARDSDDPNIRYLAYKSLASARVYDSEQQKTDAAMLLVDGLEPGREPTASRAMICRTLGELRRPEGREALRAAVEDSDSLTRGEACRALGKVGDSADIELLCRVMSTDRQADCRIAAIDGIGELRTQDPRVLTTLVENMEHSDPAVRLSSLRALRKLTGKDLGVEADPWRNLIDTMVYARPPADSQAKAAAGR